MHRGSYFLLVLTASVLLAGCRLYGGYGTVEATQEAIAAETAQASEELQSAQRSLRALHDVAEADSRLAPLVADYSALVEIHGHLVATYVASLDDVLSSDSYRALSRRLGAMLSEQRRIFNAYDELTEAAALIIAPERVPEIMVPSRMYGVYPAVYYAWWYAERATAARQVIRSAG